MKIQDQLIDLREGRLSRRKFTQTLMAAGIGISYVPATSGVASAAAADQGTYFTWGGYDLPEPFGPYIAKHGEPPNFATYGGAEEAFTKMRAGFVVDVAHPCNVEIPRWVASGLFQPIDTSRLSNWPNVVPDLYDLPGNVVDGKPYMAPVEWGQTSITYRTDLYDLDGAEESWEILWNERYKGRLASFSSGGDAWWCGAIAAGVDFKDIASEEGFAKTAAHMRKQRPLLRMYTDDETSLEQALASGELVAAMTWNSSAAVLKSQGVPVKFANPKEGALTWVCGVMIHKDAPNLDRAYDIVDSLLSEETGFWFIDYNGYGHSNAKAAEKFDDETLASLGLSRNPRDILDAGKFQIPQNEEFEVRMNEEFEAIQAGF